MYVRTRVFSETRGDQYIAPIDLSDLDRSSQLGKIPVTQLERREPNTLQAFGVGRGPERDVGAALRDEEVSCHLSRGTDKEGVEPTLGFGAQRTMLHAVSP
jgi:hypothetical protein